MSTQLPQAADNGYWDPTSPNYNQAEANKPRYTKKTFWDSPQVPSKALLSPSQLDRLIWSGRIEVTYVGQYATFSEAQIFAWLQSQTVTTRGARAGH